MRSEIVWKLVSRPPSQRWFTYGWPAASAISLMPSRACFLVPTNSTVPPRLAISAAKLWACPSSRLGLEQVDDVDAAALAEDEAAHLGVPAARLVAEVHTGLQQLLDSYLSHGNAPFDRVGLQPGRTRLAVPALDAPGRARGLGDSREPPGVVGWTSQDSFASTAARSGGSGERRSTGSPVAGWRNASRSACRNWRCEAEQAGAAVLRIAGDRVVDRLQVRADLVGAAGLEPQAQQREAVERLLGVEVGHGRARIDACRSTCGCARGGRGRAGRRSCPRGPPGGPRRGRGTRG